MPSTWGWLDNSKTIGLVCIQDDWSHEDLIAYTTDFWPEMAEQPHTVHIIVDLRQGGILPMQPMVSLLWLAQNRPRNAGRVVFIVRRTLGLALVRALHRTMQRLHPQFQISGVLTREEAVQLLTAPRIDETVEVPASSLAEADSQSPSGSPQ